MQFSEIQFNFNASLDRASLINLWQSFLTLCWPPTMTTSTATLTLTPIVSSGPFLSPLPPSLPISLPRLWRHSASDSWCYLLLYLWHAPPGAPTCSLALPYVKYSTSFFNWIEWIFELSVWMPPGKRQGEQTKRRFTACVACSLYR